MKLPFFRSRKRKAEEAARAAEQAAAAAAAEAEAAAAAAAPPPRPAKPSNRSRKVPAEQVVTSIGYALAAVPSLGPTVKAWRKLGFHVSETYPWQGCQVAHVELEGGGLRFVAADAHADATPTSDLVRQRLIQGAGLFGWTWTCNDPHRSAVAVGQLAGSDFHAKCDQAAEGIVALPPELTPAAATWLEKPGDAPRENPSHANSITRLDHLVLQVSASKAAAQAYEKNFGLRSRTAALSDRYYAYLKAGASTLEIVGPMKAPEAAPTRSVIPGAPRGGITGGPWGLAFGSPNLEATVAFLRMAGIDVKDPSRSPQGGRITGMAAPLGGIQLAFLGE